MRHLHRSALIAAGIALSLAASGIASLSASAAVAPRANSSASTTTPVGAPPLIPAGATSDGSPPSTEQVAFEVVLRPRDQAGLDAFTTAVSTPGSPSYHQFLAPGHYASRFGPSASSIANVTSALGKLGLTVGTAQGSILPVSGALSTVGAALHTAFRQYRLSSGRIARANVGAPQVPTSVAGAVQALVGLDSLAQVSHPVPNVRVLDPTGDDTGLTPAVTPDLTGPTCSTLPGGTGSGYYNAGQLASYYGLTASYTAGTLGSGTTVAIVELEPYLASDIANYQSCYGTSASVSNIAVNGGPGTGDGSGEAALDIEDVIGLAPQAAIRVYEGPLAATASDADVLAIYTAIANDDLAQVVTTSWGACEARTSPTLANGENTVFQQMAAQGQTVFAATGDSGSADCDTGTSPSTALAVDDPASQPFVTGVGGTTLTSTTGPESTWNNGIVNAAPHGGGGGVSSKWQMPAWQTSLGNVSGSSRTPCGAGVGSLCREVPDVSASADPNDGYAIYYTPPASPPGHPAGFYAFGGTSAAAPTWAALTALIDATCGGQRLGLINPALYQLRAAGTADFHDVTSGNNDAAGTNGGAYAAASGYDMATGLGTPMGSALRTDLCPAAAADGSGT
ncbi:MAG TPA: S53 family peptidase, partial [Acidothermaceae bacterium]|nr:S53 family peptidase [Acidothermaceae bacterium]